LGARAWLTAWLLAARARAAQREEGWLGGEEVQEVHTGDDQLIS
jgi:hypothetical protein